MNSGSDRIMASAQEPPPRDLYAEARNLIAAARSASLATVSDGAPFAALVTPAFMPDGAAILLLSQLSSHTRHLQANPACALLLVGEPATDNPQTAPRLCLTGAAAIVPAADFRAPYLAVHPYAELYVDFADFAFWRIAFTAAHYIGGFAAASRLDVARLATSSS
jgi:putative heme iron utilization protein